MARLRLQCEKPDSFTDSSCHQSSKTRLAIISIGCLVFLISTLQWSGAGQHLPGFPTYDLPVESGKLHCRPGSSRAEWNVWPLFQATWCTEASTDWCPLPEAPIAARDGLDHSSKFLSKDYIAKQVERLQAVVRIATESYDDSGSPDDDPRWHIFSQLHQTLADLFPGVHQQLKLDKINRYGLLYTWQGANSSLKPTMYTAHQDVVPASSISKWTYPPYEAHYDGAWLWGRGSSDCKNNLIGLLSTAEDLVSQGFQPARTILFAFGFDEEISGSRGAHELGIEIEKRYGKDGIAFIIDEGGLGLQAVGDSVYALPAVGEKGYTELSVVINTNGGHSSVPPPHTGIGILAEAITALEAHPFEPRLTHSNPHRGLLQCQARYSPHAVEPWLGRALKKESDEVKLGHRLAESRGNERFLFQTSQAVDLIHGGNKVNALPEEAEAIVNYRLSAPHSVETVKQNAVAVLKPIASKFNLSLSAFEPGNTSDAATSTPLLTLSTEADLEPAPISSTDVQNAVWNLFSGTIRQTFEDLDIYRGKTVIPAGDVMTGNTDTKSYWALTKNIYRFTPAREGTRLNAHTVDERLEVQAHVEGMRFYYDLMRNFDKAHV